MQRASQVNNRAIAICWHLLGYTSSRPTKFNFTNIHEVNRLYNQVLTGRLKVKKGKLSVFEAEILTATLKEALWICLNTGGRQNREIRVLNEWDNLLNRLEAVILACGMPNASYRAAHMAIRKQDELRSLQKTMLNQF